MNVFHRITLRTLGLNRVRTLVTIAGIVLSAAMFTGVTTSVSSLQDYLVRATIDRSGSWHGAVFGVEQDRLAELDTDPEVASYTSLQNIGYARLEGIPSDFKPYLFVAGMSDDFTEYMPVKVTRGRLPERTDEILLPEHLLYQGGLEYSLNDRLELELGSRTYAGEELTQFNGLIAESELEAETLTVRETRAYTVVGFYERPGFEDFSAPGYTALTLPDPASPGRYDLYIQLARPKGVHAFLSTKFPEYGSTKNSDLLRFSGASDETTFNATLYSLAAVLMGLVLFGSISLIYNAFSISVSERTRQYGLLASVGATRRQMMQSVLFEAAFLSVIGIPVGILAGLAGIGVTFRVSSNIIMTFLGNFADVPLQLAPSLPALVAAVVVSLAAVLISAYLPARRSFRISPIDAVRQNQDIQITPGVVRTSRLEDRLFGLEGMLARKNFKRNRRKYRATVLSLFLSVVLFISASSFTAYLSRSASGLMSNIEFDIEYLLSSAADETDVRVPDIEALKSDLAAIPGITRAGYASWAYSEGIVAEELINPEFMTFTEQAGWGSSNQPGKVSLSTMVYFIEDESYADFLAEQGLDPAVYMNPDQPVALALDFVRFFYPVEERYYTFNLLAQKSLNMTVDRMKSVKGYYLDRTEPDGQGGLLYIYTNSSGEEITLTEAEVRETVDVRIGTVIDKKAFMVSPDISGLTLMFPYSAMPKIFDMERGQLTTGLFFNAVDHKAAFDRLHDALTEKGLPAYNLWDYAQAVETDRALITVVNIFSYGFITLLSLIAAANVFNTISTNIGLRRREFAMLKSIGMTRVGFRRMMNLECLLYGFKGLVYGIPVAIGVTYLIYRAVLTGYEIKFFIPWYSLVIATGSVFAVVFATMIYAMNKIRKDNLVDALRNENL